MSVKNIKFFRSPLEIIKSFSKVGWGILNTEALPGVKARLRKSGKYFLLNWTGPGDIIPCSLPKAAYDNLLFELNGRKLILEEVLDTSNIFLRHRGVKFTENVNFFYSDGFSKESAYYFRLIIPLERKMNFHFQLERFSFEDDLGWLHAQGIRSKIEDDELDVCLFHDGQKRSDYLSIEATQLQTFNIFSEKAHAVINALGFITGYLAGNEGWYFAYEKDDLQYPNHFYHTPIRDSIYTAFTPVNTNPHAWIRDRRVADSLYDKKMLRVVGSDIFSNLCQKLYDSEDFSSAILLMMEASGASLIFRPGGYAIVLESLADLITGKDKAKAPMNPALSKKVRGVLSEVVNSMCSELPTENREILLGKINQLNQVTNKSRLRVPFDELGICLNSKDLELIATRNDFLHGRIPDITNAGDGLSTSRKNKNLYYASVRFYTLLNRLILAWVGYENYILNHAKIQEKYTRILLEEDYYLPTFAEKATEVKGSHKITESPD